MHSILHACTFQTIFLLMWIQCLLVGAVWGITNALMKIVDSTYTNSVGEKNLFNFFSNLLSNWRWVLAFLFNQIGSLLFYVTLKDADLSLAVPVCQVTTLLFTILGSFLFGERFTGNIKCSLSNFEVISVM